MYVAPSFSSANATSTDRHTELVLRLLDALDRKQFDVVDSLLSPDFMLHFSGQHLDRDQMLAFARAVYDSFSDFHHDIHETLAIGDRVVVRSTDRGTHTGDFEGTEIYEEADMLVLKQQIGAIPMPEAASA